MLLTSPSSPCESIDAYPFGESIEECGHLQERHVLMAIDLGLSVGSIIQEHATLQAFAHEMSKR
ncbi:MAG: hypothetical protein WCJ66_01655 [Verrucomicrobiota bacterium]